MLFLLVPRIFDVHGEGWVTQKQFQQGLDRLGIYYDTEDVYLFMKQYSRKREGVLR